MTFSLTQKQFEYNIKQKKDFIFYKKIKNFDNHPTQALINIVERNKFSFLYESVEKGKEKGRYTICGYKTIKQIKFHNNILSIKGIKKEKRIIYGNDPLIKVNQLIQNLKFKKYTDLPPMSGSFFGYIAYENIYNVEKITNFRKKNDLNTPDILLFLPRILIVLDNHTNNLFILKHFLSDEIGSNNYIDNKIEFKKIEDELNKFTKKFKMNLKKKKKIFIRSNLSKSNFIKNINIAKKYIKSGDIFQVVPSQRFETIFNEKCSLLYNVLRETNPSPFMYFFNLNKFKIVGSSPEILVRVRSKKVTVRPIAGTRPRGKTRQLDKANELDLLSDKKELAEHLMLLDLGRNDVGKISKKSSVHVTAKFIIERYSHVMHIVSNVVGILKKNITPLTALMAGFPAGTVSGAPKIRAMQIIDELEKTCRGIYAGGIGYISPNGDMDTCIVIRTGIIINNKLYVQAGGGVVYDSNPQKEYIETVNKAKAVLNAAAIVLGNKK